MVVRVELSRAFKKLLHATLALSLCFGSVAHAAAPSCGDLFTGYSEQRRAIDQHVLNFERGSRLDPRLDTTAEEALAWMEYQARQSGDSLLFTNNDNRRPVNEKRLKKYNRKMEKALASKNPQREVEEILTDLLVHTRQVGTDAKLKRWLSPIETSVRERAEVDYLTGSLEEVIKAAHPLKARSNRKKLLTQFVSAGGLEWANAAAISTLTLATLGIVAPTAPRAKFEYFKRLSPELREKIAREGFDAAAPELMKLYRTSATASVAWNSSRRIFILVTLVLLVDELREYAPWVKSLIRTLIETDESARQERLSRGAPAIRAEIYDGWKQWFSRTFKRDPSEAEAQAEHLRLEKIPDQHFLR